MKTFLAIVVSLVATSAAKATPTDCARLAAEDTPFAFIRHVTGEKDGQVSSDDTFLGATQRLGGGAVTTVEFDGAPIRDHQPYSITGFARNGFDIRIDEHSRRGMSGDFAWSRAQQVTPLASSYASAADFDFISKWSSSSRWWRPAPESFHARFVGMQSLSIGSCPFDVLRYEVTGNDKSEPDKRQIAFSPRLGIVVRDETILGADKTTSVITDVTPDLTAFDIGFPFDIALPIGGLPLPITGVVAQALNRGSSPGDCDRLRTSRDPYVLSSYVGVTPKFGTPSEEMPMVRVSRPEEGTSETVAATGRDPTRTRLRFGLPTQWQRLDSKMGGRSDYGETVPHVLLDARDAHLSFKSEYVSKQDDGPVATETTADITFQGRQVVQLGLCFFKTLAYSEKNAIRRGTIVVESSRWFLFAPELGIRLYEKWEANGTKRETRAFSISTNTMPLPGLADPRPVK